jgi:hypothetical protein
MNGRRVREGDEAGTDPEMLPGRQIGEGVLIHSFAKSHDGLSRPFE